MSKIGIKKRMKNAALLAVLVGPIMCFALVLWFGVTEAWSASGKQLFTISRDEDMLYIIDEDNLQLVPVGSLGISAPSVYVGMDFDLQGALYVGESRNGLLYTVSVETGEATLFHDFGSYVRFIENMAFVPVDVPGPNGSTWVAGTLFGSEMGDLWGINIETGQATFIGWSNIDMDAIAFSPDGILYAIHAIDWEYPGEGYGILYTVSTIDGLSTFIGFTAPCFGLTFTSDGRLLGTSNEGHLFLIDPESGDYNDLGFLGVQGLVGLGEGPGPVAITVTIDIKPGSFPNSINPRNKGKIPVAILTTNTFDATTVDTSTVFFGATGAEAPPVHAALEDVDGDGDMDMILHFNTQESGIVCGDTSASLTGETLDGETIRGSDSVSTVGCK